MDLTREDRIMLGHLTTRDEAGRHFTETYPDAWLARMEEAGYLTIERPVHAGTGIQYSCEHWAVIVSEEVAEWFDSQGHLIEEYEDRDAEFVAYAYAADGSAGAPDDGSIVATGSLAECRTAIARRVQGDLAALRWCGLDGDVEAYNESLEEGCGGYAIRRAD